MSNSPPCMSFEEFCHRFKLTGDEVMVGKYGDIQELLLNARSHGIRPVLNDQLTNDIKARNHSYSLWRKAIYTGRILDPATAPDVDDLAEDHAAQRREERITRRRMRHAVNAMRKEADLW